MASAAGRSSACWREGGRSSRLAIVKDDAASIPRPEKPNVPFTRRKSRPDHPGRVELPAGLLSELVKGALCAAFCPTPRSTGLSSSATALAAIRRLIPASAPVGGHQFGGGVDQPELRFSSGVSPLLVVLVGHTSVIRRASPFGFRPRWDSSWLSSVRVRAEADDPRGPHEEPNYDHQLPQSPWTLEILGPRSRR